MHNNITKQLPHPICSLSTLLPPPQKSIATSKNYDWPKCLEHDDHDDDDNIDVAGC